MHDAQLIHKLIYKADKILNRIGFGDEIVALIELSCEDPRIEAQSIVARNPAGGPSVRSEATGFRPSEVNVILLP